MNQKTPLILSVLAIAMAFFSLIEVYNLKFAETDEPEFELAVDMGYLQNYMNKLYFAGMAENTELVKYYIHEIEEILETLEEANPTYDGVVIGNLIKQYGITTLESIEEKLESGNKENFSTAYKLLVGACNGCHASSNKSYIKITEPTSPAYSNQNFEKN